MTVKVTPERTKKNTALQIKPITLREAKAFIRSHHRHHTPPRGWRFGAAVYEGSRIVGVAIAGNPVARKLSKSPVPTIEITRHCLSTRTPNAASKLYGAIRRAAFALGYKRVVTYTLATESGHSLRVSGFVDDGLTRGGSWDRPSRHRSDPNPTEPKRRWVSTVKNA